MKRSLKRGTSKNRRNLNLERLDKRELMAADLQLLRDINTDSNFYYAEIYTKQIVKVGSEGFFAFSDSSHGTELWKTDGTLDGTGMLYDLISGQQSSNPRQLLALSNSLLFVAEADDSQVALFRLGPQDTSPVALRAWGLYDSPSSFLIVDDLAFFIARDEFGSQTLWKTDGKTLSDVPLPDEVQIVMGQPLSQVGGRVLVLVGNEMLKTSLVSYDIRSSQVETVLTGIYQATTLGRESMLLQTQDEYGNQTIWFTDGTIRGTKIIDAANRWSWWRVHPPVQVENGWVTTLYDEKFQFLDLISISHNGVIEPLMRFERSYDYAEISPSVAGRALVVLPGIASVITDGSVENTTRFDIPSIESKISVAQSVSWNNKLIVPALNETDSVLLELDLSNSLFRVLDKKSFSSGTLAQWQLDASEPERLLINETSGKTLKEWDGFSLKSIDGEVGRIAPATRLGSTYVSIVANNQGFYVANLSNLETPLSSAIPLPTLSSMIVSDPIVWNDQIFFLTYRGYSLDLWRSDGTSEGTILLASDVGLDVKLIATDTRVLAITTTSIGYQVWETSGDPNSTRLIGDAPIKTPIWVASIGDKVLVYDSESLWSIEGDRWSRLFTIPLESRLQFSTPIQSGDILVFLATQDSVSETGEYSMFRSIWQTDGTATGTKKLIDNFSHFIERSVTDGDWIYFVSCNVIYRTRDRYLNIEFLAGFTDAIDDLAIADSQLFVIVTTYLSSRTHLLRWDEKSGDFVRLAEYGSNGFSPMIRNRFLQSDSQLFVQFTDLRTGYPIFQRIDMKTYSLRYIPAMAPFANPTSWTPKFLSNGLVGPWFQPEVGEELFVLSWDSIQEFDESVPRGIEVNSSALTQDTPTNAAFARLTTIAAQPGSYRYELVEGDNDNASFAIDGDRLVSLVCFDREVSGEFFLDIRTTSNSGASGIFRVTIFVDPPTFPTLTIDDWGSMWANGSYLFSPIENDIQGTNGFMGGRIELVSEPTHGEWKIVDHNILFTPAKNFVGVDSIEYVLIDYEGRSSMPAKISIQVRSRFQNDIMPVDVDRDGSVSPLDVLLVINAIGNAGTRVLDQASIDEHSKLVDIDGDGLLSPLDALSIINWINSEYN